MVGSTINEGMEGDALVLRCMKVVGLLEEDVTVSISERELSMGQRR
jgi:hypothetical protein